MNLIDTTILTPPAFGEYWPGQGGFYGGTLPATPELPAQHLVFSEAQTEDLSWGPYGTEIAGVSSRTDGRANTQALLSSGHEHPAAQWAAKQTADGHTDFHLPSQAELFIALLCAPEKFKKSSWYWSSTQTSRNYAFAQDFEYGYSACSYKDNECRVRAVRWIPA